MKTIAECSPLEWNDKLEDACEDWFHLSEEERAWELSDRLETSGISREILCADIIGFPFKSPLDALFSIIREDGIEKKLNADKLLFTHFTQIACMRTDNAFYVLLSNKKVT